MARDGIPKKLWRMTNASNLFKKEQATLLLNSTVWPHPKRMRRTAFTLVATVDSCLVLLGLISTVQHFCYKQIATRVVLAKPWS